MKYMIITAAEIKYMITAAEIKYMIITAAEMKYMRITARYTCTGHKTNTDIAEELNITPVLDKIQDYKRNWIQHVNRISRNRLPG
jgi:DNA-binding CsgD family transcriptional regulator